MEDQACSKGAGGQCKEQQLPGEAQAARQKQQINDVQQPAALIVEQEVANHTGVCQRAADQQIKPENPVRSTIQDSVPHVQVEVPTQAAPADLGPTNTAPTSQSKDAAENEWSQEGQSESKLQEQPIRRQLAVADWSPFNCTSDRAAQSGEAEKQNAGPRDEPWQGPWRHSPGRSLSRRASGSGGDTTESDSGKEAADLFVSRGPRTSSGYEFKEVKSSPRKRQAKPLPDKAEGPPKKIQRKGKAAASQQASKDESDAIAALEQIKHAGSGALPASSSHAATPNVPATAHALIEAASKFPTGALQALGRLMQQQQQLLAQNAVSGLQQSPFQGRPASPNTITTGAFFGALPDDVMRKCFSEPNAELLASTKERKERSSSGRLPAIVEACHKSPQRIPRTVPVTSPTGQRVFAGGIFAEGHYKHDTQPQGRAQSGPLPGTHISNPLWQTFSNAATNLNSNLSSALGHSIKPVSSAFTDLQLGIERKQSGPLGAALGGSEGLAASDKLGAFGSVISSVVEGEFRKSAAQAAAQSKSGIVSAARSSSLPFGNQQGEMATLFGRHVKQGTSPAANVSSSPGGVAAGAGKDGGNTAAPGFTVPPPDPHILDWVLGNRGSITDQGAGKQTSSIAAPASPDLDRFFPRAISADGNTLVKKEPAKGQNSTLRRPIAIRASDMQESLPSRTRSDGILEGFWNRYQPSAAQHAACLAPSANADGSAAPGAPASSQKLTELAVLAQQTLTTGDLGRVMQWAGKELAMRDKKVRDAEKLREEERTAHDAAMTAVATEAARLKRGQAELSVTHWKLQESLVQKDAELAEKGKLINQLSAGIAEITQQGLRAAKEAQRLHAENTELRNQLASRDALLLAEVERLEEAKKRDPAEACTFLHSLRTKLQEATGDGQQAVAPAESQEQELPTGSGPLS